MAKLKVHFWTNDSKRFPKTACGAKWVEMSNKSERVTCKRCMQSPKYKQAQAV